VVQIKVTETHKWHISGEITDANPKVPHVDSQRYFEECAKKRKQQREQADEGQIEKKVEYKIIEEKVLMKVRPDQFIIHLLGMLLLALGTYATLKALSGRASVSQEFPLTL
jgi:hypothetical protein